MDKTIRLEAHEIQHINPLSSFINEAALSPVEEQDDAVAAQSGVVLDEALAVCKMFDKGPDAKTGVHSTDKVDYVTAAQNEGRVWIEVDADPPTQAILYCEAGDTEEQPMILVAEDAISVWAAMGYRAARQEHVNFMRGIIMQITGSKQVISKVVERELAQRKKMRPDAESQDVTTVDIRGDNL